MIGREKELSSGSNLRERGVALLAVLWLSVALTMIAMTTAYLVRSEATAVGNHIAAARAEFLARGGVDAAVYALLRQQTAAVASSGSDQMPAFQAGQRVLQFHFQEGSAAVEVVPENAKLNINFAPPEQLAALFTLLGDPADRSEALAAAIAEWRSPRASSIATPLDAFYEGLPQPYAERHAPFVELEELLAVKGMNRDLFFGQWIETATGVRKRTPPLSDLLTTEQNLGGVNVNYAAYEVLRVLPGWDDSLASAVINARAGGALTTLESVPGLSAASLSAVTLAPGLSYTITATGEAADLSGNSAGNSAGESQVNLPVNSVVRHTVRARILLDGRAAMGYRVTGWWEDWPWSQESQPPEGGEGGPGA